LLLLRCFEDKDKDDDDGGWPTAAVSPSVSVYLRLPYYFFLFFLSFLFGSVFWFPLSQLVSTLLLWLEEAGARLG